MSFRVALETKALRDIEKESRSQRREGGARAESRWRSHVERFQLQLEADPLRYPQAEEADALNIDLRELIVGKKRGTAHRVLFTIRGNLVVIHRIRQAAQDRLNEDDL